MKESFPKAFRLRKNWEFQNAWKMGCKIHTPHFILLVLKNQRCHSRLGLTISRKVGNSVQRNRLKRQIREIFRKEQAFRRAGFDISVVAKRHAATTFKENISSEIKNALATSWES